MLKLKSARRPGTVLLLGALLVQLPGIRNGHHGAGKHFGASYRHPSLRQSVFARESRCRVHPTQATGNTANEESQKVEITDQESNPPRFQASGDPFDDDGGDFKKGRWKYPLASALKTVSKPPKNLPAAEFLRALRHHLVLHQQYQPEPNSLLAHFGSGPCHSFPRPREKTILPLC